MFIRTIIIFSVCFFLVPGLVKAQESLKLPESGTPGEVLRIILSEGLPPLRTIELLNGGGGIVKTCPFFSFRGEIMALLPLASTLEPGSYRLQVRRGEGEIPYSREFTLLPREFRREIIPLDGKLTSLRTEQDELKREEALEIQALYARFDEDALFDRLEFISPVDFEELDYFRISSEYGDRRIFTYIDDSSSHALHTGIDMAAGIGVPVRAAARGRVVLAKDRIISGHSVVLEHLPGVYTIYFHLRDLEVRRGQIVEKGEKIGSIGMSGLATGPHLHWEVRVNGVAVDPRELTQTQIIDTIVRTDRGE